VSIFASGQCFHFDGAVASIGSSRAALVLNLFTILVVEVDTVSLDGSSALRSSPRDVNDTGLIGNSASRGSRDGTDGHGSNGRWALATLVLNVDHYLVHFFSVEIVEYMAEVAGRSFNLDVIRDGDVSLASIMVEIESVARADSGQGKEAGRCCPADSESVFAKLINFGCNGKAWLSDLTLRVSQWLTPSSLAD